jgi:hypothetical protein
MAWLGSWRVRVKSQPGGPGNSIPGMRLVSCRRASGLLPGGQSQEQPTEGQGIAELS